MDQAATGPAPPPRHRHARDVVRLIATALALLGLVLLAVVFDDPLVGSDAGVVTGADPSTGAGRLLVALVQLMGAVAAVAVVAVVLRHRRFRLLATLVVGAVLAGLAFAVLDRVLSDGTPARLAANLRRDLWPAGAAVPGPAVFAAAAAVATAIGPWTAPSWRRATWLLLVVAATARVAAGAALPFELLLALATGAVVGSGLLVALGAPDRRIGPDGVATALAGAGMPGMSVAVAPVQGKGSRSFVADGADGRRLFVKVLGREERHADLLYRVYRFLQLRGVDDVRRPSTLRQAVEHQALVAVMAERAGVRVPRVERVAEAGDGSAMVVMDLVDGRSLDHVPPEDLTDDVLHRIWAEVDSLHRAGIAHRSLRSANVMVDGDGAAWIVDFSFSEVAATPRQVGLDVAELLASLSALVGPERAVAAAAAVVGPGGVAPAVPLLQPLALSAASRRAVRAQDGLLGRTRAAAAAASGLESTELARLARVRPRTLLLIAAASGAFYFLLPQLAQAGDSWRAFRSAQLVWLALVVPMSLMTYVGAGISILGSVPQRLALAPTVVAQMAASFANRVTPAGIGGTAVNARFLERSGVPAAAALSGVGLNVLAGGVVHMVLLVLFFIWAGSELTETFRLPAGSRVLVVVAAVTAVVGAVLATGWGRRTVGTPLRRALRSAIDNLRAVATSPGNLALLLGGSAVITLSYIGALAGSVAAFSGGLSIAVVGTVYLGASALAVAAPTPGNLGALEAAMVAALTAVGMDAGPAVSAVLTYRLATYWLPILPGWLCWSFMQRRGYL